MSDMAVLHVLFQALQTCRMRGWLRTRQTKSWCATSSVLMMPRKLGGHLQIQD